MEIDGEIFFPVLYTDRHFVKLFLKLWGHQNGYFHSNLYFYDHCNHYTI